MNWATISSPKYVFLKAGILFLFLSSSSLQAGESRSSSTTFVHASSTLQREAREVHASEQILQTILSCSDELQRSEVRGLISSLQMTQLHLQSAANELPEIQNRLNTELERLATLETRQVQLIARAEAELSTPASSTASSLETRQEALRTFQLGLETLRRNRTALTQDVKQSLHAQNQPLIEQARHLRSEVNALQRSLGSSACVNTVRVSDRSGTVARHSPANLAEEEAPGVPSSVRRSGHAD